MAEAYKQFALVESGLNSLSGTISASKVHIKKIIANNGSGDSRFFQLFDTGSVPVQPNVPRRSYRVAASSSIQIEYASAREYVTGAVYAWSSAYGTLASGAFTGLDADIEFQNG